MNAINLIKGLAAFGVLVSSGWSAATAAQGGAPEAQKTIRVLSVTGGDPASPAAAVWKKAPTTPIALQTAFPGHPSIVGTAATQKLSAQAVRSGNQLFVKLTWKDSTANTAVKDTGQFVDGAAIQFPVNGKDATTPFMGDVENAVNIWQWRADGRTQNLLAKGFGTATLVPEKSLHSAASRTRDGWQVVLSRPLQTKPEVGADLKAQGAVPIAFAVWDGQNQERDGLKAVTMEWWQLRF